MSANAYLPAHFPIEYDNNWSVLTQEMLNRLKAYVQVETVQGQEKQFNQIGQKDWQPITTITRPDQIHSAVAGSQTLDEHDHRAAQLALTNASAPLDPVKYNNLRVAVAQYDAKADHGAVRLAELQRAIAASLPSGEGGGLSKQLKGLSEKRPPSADVDAAAKSGLQALFQRGDMGQFVDGPEKEILGEEIGRKNARAHAQAATKFGKYLDAWEAHHQANPEATFEDARKWVDEQTRPDTLNHAAIVLNPAMSRFMGAARRSDQAS